MSFSKHLKLILVAQLFSVCIVFAKGDNEKEANKVEASTIANVELAEKYLPIIISEYHISDILKHECVIKSLKKQLNFDGEVKNGLVVFNWAESSDNFVQEYIIERLVNEMYLPIGRVSTANNYSNNFYSFEDTISNNVLNYYRLKQIEKSGSVLYSDVINVNTMSKPEPESGVGVRVINKGNFIDFVYDGKSEENTEIKIFNAVGNQELIAFLPTREGLNAQQIDISQLGKGSFFMQIKNGANNSEFLKFVK